jgi:DNA-binding NtrC family response regulator
MEKQVKEYLKSLETKIHKTNEELKLNKESYSVCVRSGMEGEIRALSNVVDDLIILLKDNHINSKMS